MPRYDKLIFFHDGMEIKKLAIEAAKKAAIKTYKSIIKSAAIINENITKMVQSAREINFIPEGMIQIAEDEFITVGVAYKIRKPNFTPEQISKFPVSNQDISPINGWMSLGLYKGKSGQMYEVFRKMGKGEPVYVLKTPLYTT
jgi:phosphoenolpyruvate carboxylase